MPIPSVPLSCCCDWGTGWIGSSPSVTPLVVVGHQRIVNSNTDTVNLSALDLEGNLQWQVLMGNDSFGFNKKPIHVRFGADGFIYVAWNSPDLGAEGTYKYTFGSGFTSADTVGGVDKYDRSGNLIWSCELPAQATISGFSIFQPYGNCVDISPLDGTVWTSTYRDVNDNFIHQINQSTGAVIQSFGSAEFAASAISLPYTIQAGAVCVVPWIRLTESGDIWFTISKTGSNRPGGPHKCDSSGEILATYEGTYGPDANTTIFPCLSILVMDEDDIVFCGGSTFGDANTPPDEYLVQRWDTAADTMTWGRSPFDHALFWFTTASRYTSSSYYGYWVDGDLAKFVYGISISAIDSSSHHYTVFHLDGAGDPSFESSETDTVTPFTDPRDRISNQAAIACLSDHIFAAGSFIAANATQGVSASWVVRLHPNTGRKDWINTLDRVSGGTFAFCIAASEG